MSDRKSTQSPIVRFLGKDAGQGGPFALLGLTHAIGSDQEVTRAVQRRLRQIDCHQYRTTPDANEVRLAIHSAASQLRDPALREHLVRRWPEGTPIDLPKAWAPKRAMPKLSPALMRRARMLVGSSGGWNPVARRRLAHLARVNRVGALEIIQALGGRRAVTTQGSGSSSTIPRLPDAPASGGSWIGAYAILGLLACTLIITIVLQPSRSTQDKRVTASPAQLEGDSYEDQGIEQIPTTRDRLNHYTAIAHELDRLVARAATEPQAAIARFSVIYPRFVEQWTNFPHEALERAAVNIAEFIVRLERAGVQSDRLTPLLASAGTAPDREMIAAGVIDVTLASPSLSNESRSSLRTLRERISTSGSTPGERLLPSMINVAHDQARAQQSDDTEWWQQWLAAVIHATGDDGRERDRLILDALTARLQDTDAPSSQWLRVSKSFVRELSWRAGSVERFWLIAQFGDDLVSTARLAMLTEGLVSGSSAEGVDARMVLSADANDPQRERMRDAYQDAWFPVNTSRPTPGEEGNELLNELRISIARLDSSIEDDRAIEEILTLSARCTAAYFYMYGDKQLCSELLQNSPVLKDTGVSPIDEILSADPEDDAWAERVVNCDNGAQLRPLISELLTRDTLGINSAHALVYLATVKSDSDLRDVARLQLVRSRDQIGVLLALDHALKVDSVNSKLDELATMVLQETLPNRNDPAWFGAARRAVLAQLAEALANSQQTQLASLQAELAALLDMRLQLRGLSTSIDEQRPDFLLGILNRSRRLEMRLNQRMYTRSAAAFDDAEAYATVMRARSGSPMQRYLVELEYAMRLMEIDIATKHPGVLSQLNMIEVEHEKRISGSDSVLQQIAHTQRSIAQLWTIDLERGGAP